MYSGKALIGFCLMASIGMVSICGQDPTPPPKAPEGGGAPKGDNPKGDNPKGDNPKGENPGDPKMNEEKGGVPRQPGPPGRGIKPPLAGMDTGAGSPGANSGIQFGQIPGEVGGKLLREWVQDLRSIDPSHREQAIRAIASFGPNAREAIPQLVERLRDGDSSPRMRALLALKYLDYYDKDVPKVVEGFAKRVSEDNQASMRFEAIQALGRFNYRDGHTALPAVLKASEDQTNWEIRRACYSVLPRLGSDERGVDSRVYKALMNGAKDPASMAKHEAIIGLAFLGKPNDVALAAQMEKTLLLVLQTKDPQAEIWARVALIGYNPQTVSLHTTPILKRIKDGNFATRMAAVRAIAMIGPPAREAVPDLVGCLSDRNPEMALSACIAITSMGPEGVRAADSLRQFLARMDLTPDLRQAAGMALDAVTRRGIGINPPVVQPR